MFESDDLVPVLVEAVVRSVWLAVVTAWALLLFALSQRSNGGDRRHPDDRRPP